MRAKDCTGALLTYMVMRLNQENQDMTREPISGTELLSRLSIEAQTELADGDAAAAHLKENKNVHAWLAVGIASVRLRNESMRFAGTNQPIGSAYNQKWKALSATKPDLARLDPRDRAHAMWLADNWKLGVEAWLGTLAENKRLLINHPTTIKRHYEAASKPPTQPKVSAARQNQTDMIVKLQEENDALRASLGDGFVLGVPVSELDDVANHYSPAKLRMLARELMKIADRAEEQDEQDVQDAPEVAETPKKKRHRRTKAQMAQSRAEDAQLAQEMRAQREARGIYA